jgi:hypothetical protein
MASSNLINVIVMVSACIFEILPIIQVLEFQDIFHLLEKLVLEAEH